MHACRTGVSNSAMVGHTLDDSHRINFKEASIACIKGDNGRRVLDGALIHLLLTFSGNTSFSSEDIITSRMICKVDPFKYPI